MAVPPGLPYPSMSSACRLPPYLRASYPAYIATPPGLGEVNDRCDGDLANVAMFATDCLSPLETPDQTPTKASSRTRSRALLRAKARAKRRDTAQESVRTVSDCNESLNADASEERRHGGGGSEIDRSEEASPRSASSGSMSGTEVPEEVGPTDFLTTQVEFLRLRAMFTESERLRYGAQDEIQALKHEVMEAKSFFNILQDERDRLMTQNRLLLNEWQDAVQAKRTLHSEVHNMRGLQTAIDGQMKLLQDEMQGETERASGVCSLNWFGVQTVPVLSH